MWIALLSSLQYQKEKIITRQKGKLTFCSSISEGFVEEGCLNWTLTHRKDVDIWKREESVLVYSDWVEAAG